MKKSRGKKQNKTKDEVFRPKFKIPATIDQRAENGQNTLKSSGIFAEVERGIQCTNFIKRMKCSVNCSRNKTKLITLSYITLRY